MRRALFLLPLLCFAAVATWFAFGLGRDPSRIPSALVGRPAPAVALPPLEGAQRPAFALQPGRVAIVNFFASWCAPCKVEHPTLMRLAAEGRIAVHGISYKDAAADSARFLAQLGNPFETIGWDREGRAAMEWGVYGVPETFVVGRDGTIRHRHVGALLDDTVARVLVPMVARLERE
ncbi:MAG: DsbE family thiol:disulfide interchange protein [Alphaproteobacteria bacterium]|nr:DsbE family thiol:disulfide interchange protein [Alphaproteobacteria bacterium]